MPCSRVNQATSRLLIPAGYSATEPAKPRRRDGAAARARAEQREDPACRAALYLHPHFMHLPPHPVATTPSVPIRPCLLLHCVSRRLSPRRGEGGGRCGRQRAATACSAPGVSSGRQACLAGISLYSCTSQQQHREPGKRELPPLSAPRHCVNPACSDVWRSTASRPGQAEGRGGCARRQGELFQAVMVCPAALPAALPMPRVQLGCTEALQSADGTPLSLAPEQPAAAPPRRRSTARCLTAPPSCRTSRRPPPGAPPLRAAWRR